MMGQALATLNDIGVNGLAAIAMVMAFVIFAFWAGSLGDSARS